MFTMKRVEEWGAVFDSEDKSKAIRVEAWLIERGIPAWVRQVGLSPAVWEVQVPQSAVSESKREVDKYF